ncbi:dihydroxyacetone kinase subunit DhaK [Candidatus Bipolaricaulota bacterium]|nr:dihydroxyacetone kinase subunit DhaK [Candidatus Bipolaricaulota bacterium]
MKKILNSADTYVDEMIEGILAAFPDHLKAAAVSDRGTRGLAVANAPVKDKVAIATGGGSGHIPLFLGYLGEGLADGVAVGDVFSSPSAGEMLDVTRAIHAGKGVLYLYGNYGGDVMNFGMAAEMAEAEGIEVQTSLGSDDVASAPASERTARRGIAGIFFAYKVAGAMAANGAPLSEVKRVADKTGLYTRSMGVALSPCTIPAAGVPTFTLENTEMEIGMGIHGERGIERGPIKHADEIVDFMLDRVLRDLPFGENDQVAVLVNGLGATAPSELYIMYRQVARVLKKRKISVSRCFVGEYATSMEMKGASISLLRLDSELLPLLDAPCYSPFLLQQVERR